MTGDREAFDRLLAQNERLLDALVRVVESQSPVEIIRALNPPVGAADRVVVPWGEDPPRGELVDAWGDPGVPYGVLAGDGDGDVVVPGPGSREDDGEG